MGRQYNYAVVYKDGLEAVKGAMYTGEIEYVVAVNGREAINKVRTQLGNKVKQCIGFTAKRAKVVQGVGHVIL